MSKLILGLGGNEGNVLDTFKKVEHLININVGEILQHSSTYQAAAWGNTNQPDFFNKVIEVETDLTVQDCLRRVLEIEQKMGRVRTAQKWTARTIDIDILFYNDVILKQEDLVVPHPYIQERKFVLIPLVEIVPSFIHPVFNESIIKLFDKCSDELDIKMLLKS